MNFSRLIIGLLACFCAGLVIAQSQPPTPSIGEPTHSQKEQTATKNKNDAEDKNMSRAPVSVINQAPPNPKAGKQQQNAYQWIKQATYRWGNVLSGIVVAFFTTILTAVAWLQWRTYHRQAQIMERGLVATEAAAGAAMLSAKTGKLALEMAERACIQVERVFSNSSLLSQDTVFAATIKNFGRTTAKNVRVRFSFRVPPNNNCGNGDSIMVAAGMQVEVQGPTIGFSLPEEFMSNVNNERIHLTVWVVADYCDVFGEEHSIATEADFGRRNGVIISETSRREIPIKGCYET